VVVVVEEEGMKREKTVVPFASFFSQRTSHQAMNNTQSAPPEVTDGSKMGRESESAEREECGIDGQKTFSLSNEPLGASVLNAPEGSGRRDGSQLAERVHK
jgi:hypothetical protein